MKTFTLATLALSSMLLTAGCGTPKPPGYVGPGCYDHKNRIEATIRSKAECDRQDWTWRTS